MKKTIEIKQNTDALVIPAEIVKQTSLLDAGSIDAYGTDAALLLLKQILTPMEIVRAADMLHSAVRGMCDVLKDICQRVQNLGIHVEYSPDGIDIHLPKGLLEITGFNADTSLDFDIGDGEIYICQTCEGDADSEEDPLEHTPDFLLNIMKDQGVPMETLACVLQMEELFHE